MTQAPAGHHRHIRSYENRHFRSYADSRATWRRSTIASWRSTMTAASPDVLRPGSSTEHGTCHAGLTVTVTGLDLASAYL